jgi:hypothetical protein
MKALFIEESKKNKNMPIGGGMWSTAMFHPEDAPAPTATEWSFDSPITRMPESAAPKLGKNSSLVTMALASRGNPKAARTYATEGMAVIDGLVETDPTDCVAVEDSRVGIRAARSAGLRVIAIPRVSLPLDPASLELVDLALASISQLNVETVRSVFFSCPGRQVV